LRIDGVVVGGYAEKVAQAAEELDAAAADVGAGAGAGTAEPFGELGGRLGVGQSYTRASDALRQQLATGAVALRSAAAALEQLASGHAQRDADAAEQINRAGRTS
jgi:hypothetical protein